MNPLKAINDWIDRKFAPKKQDNSQRDYFAALQSRLTNDWTAGITTADAEIRSGLKTVRARCRELERDNDYARRYFKLLDNNVLGANGIGLQMKIREFVRKEGRFVEQYDTRANQLIEEHWYRWGRKEFCTLSKKLCWVDAQKLSLRSPARDGAILIRKHYPADNPYKFALELIEADHLDTDMEKTMPDGSYIRLGVEYNAQGAVRGYHIFRDHPGDNFQPMAMRQSFREFVPVAQMIHLYMPDRVSQGDGMPWLISAMSGLKHLAAYEEAEVIAARIGAAKMGFLVPQANAVGSGYQGQIAPGGKKYMDATPGNIEQLPYGWDFKSFDPTHPNSGYKDFVKAKLRGLGAGLGVSYNSLANDLESVNYSSIRAGLIEEREEWKSIQGWFINWFVQPIFEEWLKQSLTFGAITDGNLVLPVSRFEKFNKPEWKPRRWPWVDPLKDLQADVLAVEKGFKSRRELIGEAGGDIEDTFKDIEADEQLAELHGLEFNESDEQANVQQTKPDAPDSVDD